MNLKQILIKFFLSLFAGSSIFLVDILSQIIYGKQLFASCNADGPVILRVGYSAPSYCNNQLLAVIVPWLPYIFLTAMFVFAYWKLGGIVK